MTRPVVSLKPFDEESFLVGRYVYVRSCDQPVRAFLGIPYAEAPVGERRFRPPQPLKTWTGFRDANQYGAACPQNIEMARETYKLLPNLPTVYDEDCLYLNVWTPAVTSGALLPTMVWIHGGGFVQGFSNIYDGAPLAAYENVVVVSLNYRLGVFGFLRTGDGCLDYQGNAGLLDQLEALRWIQSYIKYFDGDPNNITLFGESAGGISISYHLVSPLAKNLFHKVIIQSGPGAKYNSVWSTKGAEKFWWKRIHSMGFKGNDSKMLKEFLNRMSTDDLVSAFSDWFVPSVIDGVYIKEEPLCLFRIGQFHAVDCIIGFTSSEGVGFVPKHVDSKAEAEDIIQRLLSRNLLRGFPQKAIDHITELATAEYMCSSNYTQNISNLYGDVNFVAPSLQQAQYHSDKAPTYIYQFDHRPFFSQQPSWVRGDHGNEIPYIFGYPFLTNMPDVWPTNDRYLSRNMMKYWTNFARNGNPNGDGESEQTWVQFHSCSPYYMKIQSNCMVSYSVEELQPKRMHLWNYTLPYVIDQCAHTKSKY